MLKPVLTDCFVLLGLARGENLDRLASLAVQKVDQLRGLDRTSTEFEAALASARDDLTVRAHMDSLRTTDCMDAQRWNAGVSIMLRLASVVP